MSTDLTSLNPHLKPIKAEAEEVREAIEEFRKLWKLEPYYLVVNPQDWRAAIKSGYCGLQVLTDPAVPKFKLSA